MTLPQDIDRFVRQYAEVWSIPDADRRRNLVQSLWAPAATELISSGTYNGHEELVARVSDAYAQFGAFVFVPGKDVVAHHDALTFSTQMIPSAGGLPVWCGKVFVEFDENGQILRDHQFTDPATETYTLLAAFLQRVAAGDGELVAELFAEPVDWKLNWPAEGHPNVPWIRERHTRADVADHFRTLAEYHIPSAPDAPEIFVAGANAVVMLVLRQTVKATGRSYQARCALHLTVENNLITRYHVYEDSLSVARGLVRAG
ncbi:nuclear transport factor 2 family protein [Kineosporia babensis]|uniref:Nuclear transport factor 2 family protein n=1 Tax=Kineosporia babensis TaxID=499548 RepID=A0A9X1SR63_9ACTN|nr:nuclear transport factor 2 family protein [Kineosporia babensis]MCD5309342.1 nuclear transport factor 2 family protein [Kineosporia babensis]